MKYDVTIKAKKSKERHQLIFKKIEADGRIDLNKKIGKLLGERLYAISEVSKLKIKIKEIPS